MSSELERRLEGLLAEAPEPDPGAGEEALHRALHSLRPVAPVHRGLRTALLAFAAAGVLLVIAAGSLAAAGALHVSFGAKGMPRPTTQLVLPRGANGVAAIVDGRLTVVTKGFPPARAACQRSRPLAACALRRDRHRQLTGRDCAACQESVVASRKRQGRLDRVGTRRPADRIRRPRRNPLRPARHLRERRPRHDDRPLGAAGAAVVAGGLARRRVRRCGREGDRLRHRSHAA